MLKYINYIHRSGKGQLLWDGDWRPEGTGIQWNNSLFFANGLGTWIESDSNKGQSFAYLTQFGINVPIGGTDSKGSVFRGSYAIDKNFNTVFTYFINDVGLKSGDPVDFKRLQLDLSFKY